MAFAAGQDCIFCRIVAGLAPASIIYQDNLVLAFLDTNPVTKGHTLVIPKRHAENIYDCNAAEAGAMLRTGAALARAMKANFACVGVNFWMANERPAGQVVPHAHLHIIPRYDNDGIRLQRGPGPEYFSRAALDEMAVLLRQNLEVGEIG